MARTEVRAYVGPEADAARQEARATSGRFVPLCLQNVETPGAGRIAGPYWKTLTELLEAVTEAPVP